jgi:hypothetical protein
MEAFSVQTFFQTERSSIEKLSASVWLDVIFAIKRGCLISIRQASGEKNKRGKTANTLIRKPKFYFTLFQAQPPLPGPRA